MPVFHVFFDIYSRTHFSFHYNDFSNEKGEHLEHNRNNNRSRTANTKYNGSVTENTVFWWNFQRWKFYHFEHTILRLLWYYGALVSRFPEEEKKTFDKTSIFCPFTLGFSTMCNMFQPVERTLSLGLKNENNWHSRWIGNILDSHHYAWAHLFYNILVFHKLLSTFRKIPCWNRLMSKIPFLPFFNYQTTSNCSRNENMLKTFSTNFSSETN